MSTRTQDRIESGLGLGFSADGKRREPVGRAEWTGGGPSAAAGLVHQVRSPLRFVPYRDKKKVAADLKKIYTAVDRDHAEAELEAFAERWDERYPMISASWLEHWERIVPFLAFPPEVRRAVYTTNTIEALNRQIRKIVKTRGSFPSEDSARKLLYLAITGAQRKWRHTYNWSVALVAFRIHFGERLPDTAI